MPLGTVVYDDETGELLGESSRTASGCVVAAGGRGGRGNARFATATHQAPRHAEPGSDGEERRLRLELKLLADVGLVGLPNAGKSTLIASSRRRGRRSPTTRSPRSCRSSAWSPTGPLAEPFVVADMPGLIEGAAQGAGLGIQFLRHVERCRVLLHLVDSSSSEGERRRGPRGSSSSELTAFNPELMQRPRLICRQQARRGGAGAAGASCAAAAKERGVPYREISAATGTGCRAAPSPRR